MTEELPQLRQQRPRCSGSPSQRDRAAARPQGATNVIATTTTDVASQKSSGHGHVINEVTTSTDSKRTHVQTRVHHAPSPPPPPPPTVYTSAHLRTEHQQLQNVVRGGPNEHVLDEGAEVTSSCAGPAARIAAARSFLSSPCFVVWRWSVKALR